MAATAALSSTFSGVALPTLPARKTVSVSRSLKVSASGGKKIKTNTPLGPSGDYKFKVDPSGSPSKGKGAYSFAKKYGANVDGYSPIWTPSEWSAKGDTYEGGKAGLLLWFLTFGGLLAIGALLIVNTSAIA
ncbi:hypothetical protein CLOM_g14986 [Closterium sp. NIES-68]|nr:hypothetical protein CLOM_g14986 [Closterium sp. NIES-68]GJP58412.1 hypothetical protein CLOP_g23897 [Closterium sp. NIES-67]GJP71205.1 hypothetical protein CLOP_g2051 [Closterium sp. NIES-67]GJP74202.1 hypothetical protein CLOP_g4825 [Closterium sp. NIES-67]